MSLIILFLLGGAAGFFSVPAWSYDAGRDEVVTRYLDFQEVAITEGAEPQVQDNDVPAEPPDVKETYIGQQERFFVAPSTEPNRHSFNADYEMYNYGYQETVQGQKFMNTKGAYSGFSANYAYHPDAHSNPFYEFVDEVRLQGLLASGDVDYTGSGTFSGLKDRMYELRALVAKSYSLDGGITAIPYLGLGYRYLNNGLEAYQPGGYNRESRYFYLPAGGDLRKQIGGGWGLAMNLEYDRLLKGEQTSHAEDMDPSLDPLVNNQSDGYGIRGSLKVSKEFDKKWNIFVEPFIRYWNIKESDVKPITSGGVQVCDPSGDCWSGSEPDNVTQEIGLKMGIGF